MPSPGSEPYLKLCGIEEYGGEGVSGELKMPGLWRFNSLWRLKLASSQLIAVPGLSHL